MRFPRVMLNGPANERLLESLGIVIVDDCDADLEAAARKWLAETPRGDSAAPISRRAVERALAALDARRAA